MVEVDDIHARLQNELHIKNQEIQARDAEILRIKDQLLSAERDFKVCQLGHTSWCAPQLLVFWAKSTFNDGVGCWKEDGSSWWRSKEIGETAGMGTFTVHTGKPLISAVHGGSWRNPSSTPAWYPNPRSRDPVSGHGNYASERPNQCSWKRL